MIIALCEFIASIIRIVIDRSERRKIIQTPVSLLVTARVFRDAARVQVSRHVRLVHGEDLLDAIAEFSRGWRQPEGPFRRRISSVGEQFGPYTR